MTVAHAIRASSEHQATAFGLWNRIAEFFCRIDPQVYSGGDVGECFFRCWAVRGAAWQLRNVGNVRSVLVTPVNDDFVLSHASPSNHTSE